MNPSEEGVHDTHTRIIVTHYGGPDALQVLEEKCPEPKDGEVQGVSLADIMAREGVHPETPRVPYTPGWDLVGEVDRPGDGVSGIEPGQIVAAMLSHGAYASWFRRPPGNILKLRSALAIFVDDPKLLKVRRARFAGRLRRVFAEISPFPRHLR